MKKQKKAEGTWEESLIPMTRDGAKKLEERLLRIKASLPKLIEETARTAAYGDRSENAEYQAAKGALRRANYLILEIEDQLRRLKIIEDGPDASGAIRLGSAVTLKSRSGKEYLFHIVGPRETDPARGRISHESPMGSALMGKKKGEKARVVTPKGEDEYEISEIK